MSGGDTGTMLSNRPTDTRKLTAASTLQSSFITEQGLRSTQDVDVIQLVCAARDRQFHWSRSLVYYCDQNGRISSAFSDQTTQQKYPERLKNRSENLWQKIGPGETFYQFFCGGEILLSNLLDVLVPCNTRFIA